MLVAVLDIVCWGFSWCHGLYTLREAMYCSFLHEMRHKVPIVSWYWRFHWVVYALHVLAAWTSSRTMAGLRFCKGIADRRCQAHHGKCNAPVSDMRRISSAIELELAGGSPQFWEKNHAIAGVPTSCANWSSGCGVDTVTPSFHIRP